MAQNTYFDDSHGEDNKSVTVDVECKYTLTSKINIHFNLTKNGQVHQNVINWIYGVSMSKYELTTDADWPKYSRNDFVQIISIEMT